MPGAGAEQVHRVPHDQTRPLQSSIPCFPRCPPHAHPVHLQSTTALLVVPRKMGSLPNLWILLKERRHATQIRQPGQC